LCESYFSTYINIWIEWKAKVAIKKIYTKRGILVKICHMSLKLNNKISIGYAITSHNPQHLPIIRNNNIYLLSHK
jgi:hypothetical protein